MYRKGIENVQYNGEDQQLALNHNWVIPEYPVWAFLVFWMKKLYTENHTVRRRIFTDKGVILFKLEIMCDDGFLLGNNQNKQIDN